MKYTYHFANGESQEIEVTEAQYLILKDADRMEYNNDHANTRRHVSLDMVEADEGMQFADPSSLPMTESAARLHAAIEQLRPDQQELIQSIYFDDMSVNDYAASKGVTPGAISQRFATAAKKLKKILSDPKI